MVAMGFIGGVFRVAIGIVVAIIIVVVIIGAAATSGGGKEAAAKVEHDSREGMINDMIQQYDIAASSGAKMDACVRAGLVAEMLLQAKNEKEYRQWKATEKKACRKAGL